MGSAPERSVLVDQALVGFWMEKRAGSVGGIGQLFSPRGTEGLRGKKGLASSELGCFSCEFELATFGPAKAVSLNRALIQFLVGGTDLVKDLFQEF